MPLTKRNAHEQRLPQMPRCPCPMPHACAGVADDDGCDDADGQCGNVGIGFCLLQLCKTTKKNNKNKERNKEHLVGRKGVLCGSGWASQVSACLLLTPGLPACLPGSNCSLSALLGSGCGCAHEKFIHSVEFRA